MESGSTEKESTDASYIESSVIHAYDELTEALKRLGLIAEQSPRGRGPKRLFITGKSVSSQVTDYLSYPLHRGRVGLLIKHEGGRDVLIMNWSSSSGGVHPSEGRYTEIAISKPSHTPTVEVDSHPTYTHETGTIDFSGNRTRVTYFQYSMGKVINNEGVSNPISEIQWKEGEQKFLDARINPIKAAAVSAEPKGLISRLIHR